MMNLNRMGMLDSYRVDYAQVKRNSVCVLFLWSLLHAVNGVNKRITVKDGTQINDFLASCLIESGGYFWHPWSICLARHERPEA